jgi:hypothetical protein
MSSPPSLIRVTGTGSPEDAPCAATTVVVAEVGIASASRTCPPPLPERSLGVPVEGRGDVGLGPLGYAGPLPRTESSVRGNTNMSSSPRTRWTPDDSGVHAYYSMNVTAWKTGSSYSEDGRSANLPPAVAVVGVGPPNRRWGRGCCGLGVHFRSSISADVGGATMTLTSQSLALASFPL